MTKIVLVGPSGAGKTALSIRLVRDEFVENHIQLKGCQYLSKDFSDMGEADLYFDFWDVEFKKDTMNALLKSADLILCLFSLADKQSLFSLKKDFLENKLLVNEERSEEAVFILLGTHDDSPKDVTIEEVNEVSNLVQHMKYFPVSAKTNKGIETLFAYLKEKALEPIKNNAIKIKSCSKETYYSKDNLMKKRLAHATTECGALWSDSQTPLNNVRLILQDYAQNNNGWHLWYLWHANRRNTWAVNNIVRDINFQVLTDVRQIIVNVDAINHKNPDGALSLRLTFMKSKLSFDESKAFNEVSEEKSTVSKGFCGLF